MATDFDRIERIRRLADELKRECGELREYPQVGLSEFLTDTIHECGLLVRKIEGSPALRRRTVLHAPVSPQGAPVLHDTTDVLRSSPLIAMPAGFAVERMPGSTFREQIAARVLPTLIMENSNEGVRTTVRDAVRYADVLIAELASPPEGKK